MAKRDDLMTEIGQILSLPPTKKGVGSSVYNDFIDPMAEAVLGPELADLFHDKYRKIEKVIEALGGTYLPGDPNVRGAGHTSEGTQSGGGGTLTNFGLETIRDLLLQNGAPNVTWDTDQGARDLVDEGFDPADIVDERVKRQAEIATRPGGTRFRNAVRAAYDERCCISGADHLAVLEAAHIVPYQGEQSDVVSNALLLRADLHKLHDALLLAVDEDLTVLLKPSLRGTQYEHLEGRKISPPRGVQLSAEALRFHKQRCGF